MILTTQGPPRKPYLAALLFLAILCCFISIALASPKPAQSDFKTNQAISNLQNYLNNLGDAVIEFQQESLKTQPASGAIFISKPHRFRVNYYAPFPLLILGNKNFISLYDYEMQNLSRLDANKNNFNFFLLNNNEFRQRYQIEQASFSGQEAIVKFHDNETGLLSQISFNKKTGQPLRLQIYEEKDIISLQFTQIWHIDSFSKKHKQELFTIQNPDVFGPPQIIKQRDVSKILQKTNAKKI